MNKMATLNLDYLSIETIPRPKKIIRKQKAKIVAFKITKKQFKKLNNLLESDIFLSLSEALRFLSFYFLEFHESQDHQISFLDTPSITKEQFLNNHKVFRADSIWNELPLPCGRMNKPDLDLKVVPMCLKATFSFMNMIDKFSNSHNISRSVFLRNAIDFSYDNLMTKSYWRLE